ncbi:MAG: ParB N-terminal domain-containing protein [Nitrospinales bacterium]
MNINISKISVCKIPHPSILSDSLTDFSLSSSPENLKTSIQELGVTNPVILLRVDKTESFRIISGHRRVSISKVLGFRDVIARVVEEQIDSATCLKINILDNLYHRTYSDIEKGIVINKVSKTGLNEREIIEEFLPFLEIQPSKKLMDQFLKSNQFSKGLQLLLHENNIPIRVFATLFNWNDSDRNALEKLIQPLHLGINKWREFIELVDETARRENITPAAILDNTDLNFILDNNEIPIHKKYDSIIDILKLRRFPAISEMQKKFYIALDKLDMDPRTKVRAAKYFEDDEIKIELKFSRQADLLAQVEKLANAAGSEAMRDLIKLISGAR